MAKRCAVEGVDMSEFWQGRSVFVTGATGLIGSWLVKRLLELQAEVTVLIMDAESQSELYRSRAIDRVHVINGRLEELSTLERAINQNETGVVFHLGAQTLVPLAHRAPLATFESNIRGTYNVLEACRTHRALVQRIILASSDKAYGEHDRAYHEEMRLNASYPYEVSKACGELIATAYYRTYGLPVVVARCGNVYGGGDLNWSRIVPGTIRSLLLDERPIIRSNGELVRDYFYVEDAAQAYVALAEQAHRSDVQGQAFNFSMESPMTVLEMVRLLQRLMGCASVEPRILNDAPGELEKQTVLAEKARRVLEWQAQWNLEDGLQKTIAWYRAFFEAHRVSQRIESGLG